MPQIVWIARPDGWHTYFNRKWFEFTGLTLAESLGHGWNPAFHPDDRQRAAEQWQQATLTGTPYEIEYRLRKADGTHHWMLGRAAPLRDASGEIVTWFGTCTDIEELKQAQGRIEEQARLLDLAQDAIFVQDLTEGVVYWNHGAERAYGWSAQDAAGRRLDELVAPDPAQAAAAWAAVLGHGQWNGELRCRDRTGQTRLVESRWTLLRHGDGTPKGLLAVGTDVTDRRATEANFIQMLEAEATRDPLTRLPNRALLTERLAEAVTASQRDGRPLAVLFVDLDAFKDINDGSGHLLGDQVLVEVAARLSGAVREGDTVARFGGDEFVVLLPATDEAAAERTAQRLLAAVLEPMEVDGRRLHVSASIGLAVSPPVEPEALLRSADAAVYDAKSRGRAQVRAFVGELSWRAEERVRLSSDLTDALEHDRLELVYQPVVDLTGGQVLGVEALLRWEHPSRGAVPPDVFVTVAEEAGSGAGSTPGSCTAPAPRRSTCAAPASCRTTATWP
jgi:diguanylate cyclase (GGDEF)-like protein/PAS domain S-box-containing protein